MSLLDAITSVLGGIWGFISAPTMVALYGIVLAIVSFYAVLAALAASETWYARLLGTAVFLATCLLGVSLFVWGLSSDNPFVWRT